MMPLPLAAFPIGANTTKSSGFAIAVLIGLAVFMAQQKKTVSQKIG
jgi:hypothetical protein